MIAFGKSRFGFFLFHENDMIYIFRAFVKSMFLNWRIYFVSDIEES